MKRIIFLLLFSSAVCFAADVVEFNTQQQSQRYQKLIAELRCLVCQNQNLADSNADLAVDLKNIVQQKILDGESDQQILQFMTDRYGDFVLYRPPLKSNTFLLWLGPMVFLILGLFLVLVYVKRSKQQTFQVTQHQRDDVRQKLDSD